MGGTDTRRKQRCKTQRHFWKHLSQPRMHILMMANIQRYMHRIIFFIYFLLVTLKLYICRTIITVGIFLLLLNYPLCKLGVVTFGQSHAALLEADFLPLKRPTWLSFHEPINHIRVNSAVKHTLSTSIHSADLWLVLQ